MAIAKTRADAPVIAQLTDDQVADPAFQDLLKTAEIVATVIGYMRGRDWHPVAP